MSDNAQTPPTAEELAAWEQEAQQMRASCTCDYCRAHDPHWRLTRLIAALTAERERLDWLEAGRRVRRGFVLDDAPFSWMDSDGDLRTAIDAARTREDQ